MAGTSKGILEGHSATLVARVVSGDAKAFESFAAVADEKSDEADFMAACCALPADLARGNEDDDDLFDAHVKVAALAQVDGVSDELDRETEAMAKRWFVVNRVALKELTDERRAVYDEITGMSPEPQVIEVKRPRIRTEETEDDGGNELETRTGHLLSDHNGNFPVGSLNKWEIEILDKEMERSGFQAWYRNPPRPSGDALAITYVNARGQWRRMCPDFLFFHGDSERGNVSIVDPHGHHLADALPRLRGLAAFAAKNGAFFHRIESVVRMTDGTLRVLDLTDSLTGKAVAEADDAQTLYLRDEATNYSDYRGRSSRPRKPMGWSEKAKEYDSSRHEEINLDPVSPDFEPIMLTRR